jgi:hypothetical protein
MQVLAGLFVLAATAAFGVWHLPEALELLESKVRARRIGLKTQRTVFLASIEKLKGER